MKLNSLKGICLLLVGFTFFCGLFFGFLLGLLTRDFDMLSAELLDPLREFSWSEDWWQLLSLPMYPSVLVGAYIGAFIPPMIGFPILGIVLFIMWLIGFGGESTGDGGIGGVAGGGGREETKSYDREEYYIGPMSKSERKAYHKGYSDAKRYGTENPPDQEIMDFRWERDKAAYEKGWSDSKKGKPRKPA